ncbi:MAG: hypothetical protein AB7V10_06035 [Leucobacter sp.]|jgi:hypothetical protein
MRVVISGTHGSGKSTLIGDFAAAHREWAILPEPIEIGADEDLELREAMDLSLLELADDPDLAGAARVVEITGDHARRLARLEGAIDGRAPAAPGILAE